MSIEVILPLNNYPNGQTVSDVADVPDEATAARFSLLRCTAVQSDIWPDPETHVTAEAEINLGAGWIPWMSPGEFWGGIIKNKFGQDIAESYFSSPLPEGTGRQMRVTITVENGPLRSEGTFSFTTPV